MELLFWAESAFAPAAERQIFYGLLLFIITIELKNVRTKSLKKFSVVNQAKGVPMAGAPYAVLE